MLQSKNISKIKLEQLQKSKIKVEQLSKIFKTANISVLQNVNFSVNDKEFVSIIGPSGCGKSTLLRIIAGIIKPASGSIKINDTVTINRKGVASYLPQDNALLPWRTVIDNVLLGLEVQRKINSDSRKEALTLLNSFGLKGFENAYIWQLSGGMCQRVALMRTLLCHKDIVLMDEPFGSLDALTRRVMQDWLISLEKKFKRTFILVTHDIDEAIFLSDRVLVMSARPGRIVKEFKINKNHGTSKEDTDYYQVKKEILNILKEETLRSLKQQEYYDLSRGGYEN